MKRRTTSARSSACASVTLVTGGARSGKSRFALQEALACKRRAFIATATASDDEMAARIGKHRAERGNDFLTIEEPVDPARAIAKLPEDTDVAVIDCMAVWVGNLMHRHPDQMSFAEVDRFLSAIRTPPCDLLVVTNEVGMGIVPANELARNYRDILGSLNQEIARISSRTILMVSGIPVVVKGKK